MTRSEARYLNLIVEEMRSQFKVVHEAVADIRRIVNNQPTRQEFDELRADVKTIKAALKDTNKQVANHEIRLTKLETTHP
jgi:hypothetical protein